MGVDGREGLGAIYVRGAGGRRVARVAHAVRCCKLRRLEHELRLDTMRLYIYIYKRKTKLG